MTLSYEEYLDDGSTNEIYEDYQIPRNRYNTISTRSPFNPPEKYPEYDGDILMSTILYIQLSENYCTLLNGYRTLGTKN